MVNDMKWSDNIFLLNKLLADISITNDGNKELGINEGFSLWVDETSKIRNMNNTVFLIGNGASASMASHMACDLSKNAKIKTEVFFDLSMLTALGNDLSFEEIFSQPIDSKMTTGDMLVAISSSGQSSNIINGVRAAQKKGGKIITLSAMNEDNLLRSLGMLNIYLPAKTYGFAETGHAALLHYWMDLMAELIE